MIEKQILYFGIYTQIDMYTVSLKQKFMSVFGILDFYKARSYRLCGKWSKQMIAIQVLERVETTV